MNDEVTAFEDIEHFDISQKHFDDLILVCSPEFNSSVYHFILPLRARYLQKITHIGKYLNYNFNNSFFI